MSDLEVHRLENGLTVVLDVIPTACSAAVTLLTRAGSRYDPVQSRGLAHFAEHMLFKGAGTRSSDEQAEAIEDLGAEINAWTSTDHMAIDLRSLGEHVPTTIDIVASMIRDPWLKDEDVESEKAVVLSEMDGEDDDMRLIDIAHAIAYAGHAYAIPTIGTREHVQELDAATIRAWLTSRFRPGDMVLSVSGGIDTAVVLRTAAAAFGDMQAMPALERDLAPAFHAGRTTGRSQTGQGKLALLWEAPVSQNSDFNAWALAMAILGGSPSSRLFRRIRQDLGLCYDVHAWTHSGLDVAQGMVEVTTEPGKVRQAYREIMQCIGQLATDATEAELQRAKTRNRSALLMAEDNVKVRSEKNATYLLDRGRPVSICEMVKKIDEVDLARIKAVAQQLATDQKVVANIGGGARATV